MTCEHAEWDPIWLTFKFFSGAVLLEGVIISASLNKRQLIEGQRSSLENIIQAMVEVSIVLFKVLH
jgi:hypothetical protein